MTKTIYPKQKLSLSIHQRIRSAEFVKYSTKTFKYDLHIIFKSGITQIRYLSSIVYNKSINIYNSVIWDRLLNHASIWLLESFIEGLAANYVLYVLFDRQFNIFTIFAYGILIKQGIDIYHRLKCNGSIDTVSKD